MGVRQAHIPATQRSVGAWWALLVMALLVYAFGLGSQYIPTNGDELVYAHIARVTAGTGHWLPLASELDNMRNTKPPLLFWQAMVAGDWGNDWHMAALRLPSLIYTFLTTAAIAVVVLRITCNAPRTLLAACIYLAFFSTFRYGRPYLTSAPETFWLALPMLTLLWISSAPARLRRQLAAAPLAGSETRIPLKSFSHTNFEENSNSGLVNSAQIAPLSILNLIIIGALIGIGLLFKSFALVAPAGATMWLALVLMRQDFRWRALWTTTLQVGFIALLALAIFALWFVLDPDPQAVWKEFIVGENIGKMGDKVGYWHEALYGGGSSLWAQLFAYIENAGLLGFVVLGLVPVLFKAARTPGFNAKTACQQVPPHLWVLFAWLAVWLLVFSIPSQRSARYVIPAMPALAIVLALYWDRISGAWFIASGFLITLFALVMARIVWVAHDLKIATTSECWMVIAAVGILLGTLLLGWLKPAFTRTTTLVACLLFYGVLTLTTLPLEGPSGRYSTRIQAQFVGQKIAVPSNFNAQWERFEFLLPGNRIVPFEMALIYKAPPTKVSIDALLASNDALVWMQENPTQTTAPCLPTCQLIAERWVIKERHQAGDITWANVWTPHTWLFSREWLLRSGGGGRDG